VDVYSLQIAASAQREFEAIPFPFKRQLNQKVNSLKNDPRPRGCERIGEDPLYRIRTGGWVALYWIDEAKRAILVLQYRRGA